MYELLSFVMDHKRSKQVSNMRGYVDLLVQFRPDLSKCLIMLGLSIVIPDVGKRTGSFINSFVNGSRNSSGA